MRGIHLPKEYTLTPSIRPMLPFLLGFSVALGPTAGRGEGVTAPAAEAPTTTTQPPFAALDAEAASGEPARIRKAIAGYEAIAAPRTRPGCGA